jgi:hypothetical protein
VIIGETFFAASSPDRERVYPEDKRFIYVSDA